MHNMWFAVGLFFTIIGSLNSLPAPVPSLLYETGISYKYNYQFTILLNEDSNITSRTASVGRNVGYRVSSEFVLSSVWQSPDNPKEKLLKLELLKPSLHVSSTMHSTGGIDRHWSKLDNLSYPPMYIHWLDGMVKKVYVLPDTPSLINIKKGLASLFQFRLVNDKVKELDVSGVCDVRYKYHSNTIKKSKLHCHRSSSNYAAFSADQLLTPTIFTSSEAIITLKPHDVYVETISGKEEVRMTLNVWKQAAVFVKSKFHVNFVEQYENRVTYSGKNAGAVLNTIMQESGSKLKGEPLEIKSDGNEMPCFNCKSLPELVQEFGINLLPEYLGEVKSASGFLKFLPSFRKASKKELLMLFENTDVRIITQLLDVLAVTQTEEALDVALQLIDFESKDIGIAERFLLCLATIPHPNEALISKTMQILERKIESEKLRATVLISLSSLVKTYCKNNSTNANSLVVQNLSNLLLRELQGCDHLSCTVNHLLALRNAALPQHIPVLLEYVKKGGILGLMALEGIKDIGHKHFNQEVNKVLIRVYKQFWPHQESAARILAAEMLINNNPSAATISDIILSLSDREFPEINTIVLSKLYTAMERNKEVRSCIQNALRNITFGNFNNLAQNGSSINFIKSLQDTHDANITYGINLEMRPTGMLKRTSFDLNLLDNHDNVHLLSMALFVEGFGLTNEEAKENPEEHSAGMQLSVLGVHLRPYIFFTGTAELMGLVWSAAGSEPTPALQANFLVMDQTHTVVLQNGIVADLNLKGALSTDISGTIEVSMWNKNAHAVVKNKAALLINGFCRVDTSFVESRVDFAMGGSSSLDMMVDLDFGKKPMSICLQVEKPDNEFRHNVRKTEKIPGSKHLIKTVKRRTMYFPGKSLNLHRKNSQSCQEMLYPKKQKTSFW